jgi:hypothetical protein
MNLLVIICELLGALVFFVVLCQQSFCSISSFLILVQFLLSLLVVSGVGRRAQRLDAVQELGGRDDAGAACNEGDTINIIVGVTVGVYLKYISKLVVCNRKKITICAARESNPAHKNGNLECYHYTSGADISLVFTFGHFI